MHTNYYFSFEMLLPEFFSELELQVWKDSRNMQMKSPHLMNKVLLEENQFTKMITNNSLELLQTVKELSTEMEIVKKENERILRAQEELN